MHTRWRASVVGIVRCKTNNRTLLSAAATFSDHRKALAERTLSHS